MSRLTLNRAFLVCLAVVAAFWLSHALIATDMWPRWLYVIALPGMDVYRLVFAARNGYEGWLAALIVVPFSAVYWSLVLCAVSAAVRYAKRVWVGSAALDAQARVLNFFRMLKLGAIVSALVLLVAFEVAGPEFATPLWFDWFFFVLLPGDMANQLLPFAHFSGAPAIAFIAVSAAIAWTFVIVVIDSIVRLQKRRRSGLVVA